MTAGGPVAQSRLIATPEPQPHLAQTPHAPAPSSASTPSPQPPLPEGSGAPITPAMQQAQEAQKEKDWYEKRKKEFLAIFAADKNWKLENAEPQKDKKFIFKNTVSGEGAVIEVLANKGISLSGDATHEIAQAAMRYHRSEDTPEIPIRFKVEAQNQKEASDFIKGLEAGGFKLGLITSIEINGTKMSPQEFEQFMQVLKAEITQCRPTVPST